jgi:hypothetical protein
MNAALFTAILYLAKAERHEGRVDSADALSRSVSHFVAYLNDEILLREQCGSRWCIRWQYASYIRRAEDVGHANNVVRFLVAAQEEHYPVPYHHLVEIANTIDTITNPDGSFRSNLLDGSSIEGTRDSIYDILLLARYSPSLKSKFQAVMAHGPSFSYLGPWRAANR